MTMNRNIIIAAAVLAAASSTAFAQTNSTPEEPPTNQTHGNLADQGTVGKNQLNPNNDASSAVGAFTAIPAKDRLSSRVVGLEVRNNANEAVATIEDIAFNESGIDGFILSVGGFLGVADRYVAVRSSSIDLTYDRANNKWRATMDASAEQLKAAPEFKYPGNT
ncbi:hypothetical protein V1277_005639 [Bradyrhizobium sp. AZCC 1588]|uniref:PRC-barrel domain-containing protein n=1 Tax=unclassified Bradyrhizobium TaxID=2631580 RepID=UPI002FF15055